MCHPKVFFLGACFSNWPSMVTGEDLRRLCVFEGSVPPHPFLRRPEQRLFDLHWLTVFHDFDVKLRPLFASGKVSAAMKTHGAGFHLVKDEHEQKSCDTCLFRFLLCGSGSTRSRSPRCHSKMLGLGVVKVKTIPWFIIICPECFQVLLCCRTVYSCTCSWWCLHEATTWKCAPLMCRCKSLVFLLTSIMCILMTSHIWNAYFNCQLTKKGPPNHQMHT